jgi:hypothetical protein
MKVGPVLGQGKGVEFVEKVVGLCIECLMNVPRSRGITLQAHNLSSI